MLPFTHPNLFNAHALPVDDNEPHAQVGNHLRVNTHPLLGLPVAPFLVERAVMGSVRGLNTRSDVVFTDKDGRLVLAPFDLTPDDPVTVHIVLSAGEACLWAQVDAISQDDSRGAIHDGRPTTPIITERPQPPTRGSRTGPIRMRPTRRNPVLTLPGAIPPAAIGQLHCEAFINSAMGPASIGTRSKRRYAFSAPGIVEIEIRGAGRVSGVRWIEATDPQHIKFEPFAILNLPHKGGARYVAIDNAIARAISRVEQQAPKRRPLHETVNAPAPPAAPIADVPFEHARVRSLLPNLSGDLEHLINDLSLSPFEQIIKEKILDENGAELGNSSMARLHRVIHAQGDPGTASFLGYKLRDADFREVEDHIVFYRIDGFFHDFPPNQPARERPVSELLFDAMVAAVPIENRNWTRGELLARFAAIASSVEGVSIAGGTEERLEKHGQYFGLGTLAIADRGAPLDRVPAPTVTRAAHKDWLPGVPPEAKREVIVDVARIRVAGLLAAGKRTPAGGSGGQYAPMNRANADGFHLPLVLSLNLADETGDPIMSPGTGFVADRTAEPPAIRYFVAQEDRFGRWSDWAARNAAPGPRPKPPPPQFQAFYTQPTIGDAATSGGAIVVKVMVPDAAALAPGSNLLDRLRLLIHDKTLGTTTTLNEPQSNKVTLPVDPTTFYLHIPHNGPVLQATEQRQLRLTAHWIDTANVLSTVSEPQTLTLTDPRPPAQLAVPDTLQYSARPDVTGLSWVEHRWTSQPGQAQFGVYYTDENRLLSHLQSIGQVAVLNQLDAATDAAARAAVYRSNVGLFPDHLLERLRDVGVEFNSGQQGFRHAVSGSLRVLNFYKIAAEAASGAKPVLTDLDLIVYGVPNSDPPPRPVLEVVPVSPEPGEQDFVTEVKINLRAGTTLGETWRLRRSAVESQNIAKMPIVSTGAMGTLDAANGLQSAIYRDDGPVQIAATASLRPWVRYSWVAEIQGVPESGSIATGSPVPGRWSRASDPVSLILIPTAAPPPFVIDAIAGVAGGTGLTDVHLTLSHPEPLTGGAVGSYRIRVSRRQHSGGALTVIREQELFGNGPFEIDGVADARPGEVVPTGAEYVVQLIDPVGRSSDTVTGQVL